MISISTKKRTLSHDHYLAGTACVDCTNEGCLIKRNLKSTVLSKITEGQKQIRCKKGQQFILEGAPVTGLFFVLKGKAKVFRTGLNGKEQIVRFATKGEIIGHRGFGTEESYTISAVAIEDSTLCYFSKESLQEVLHLVPSFTYDLMLFYADELNKSEAKVKSLSQMTVRERVIDTLLYVNRKFGQEPGFLAVILSRREYADYAGTTEEQVIRVLSALRKENLITTKGKRISIIDISLLQNEISEHNFYLTS